MANACLGPHAVMVQLVDAFPTRAAVRVARPLPIVAFITSLRVVQLVGLRILFLEFIHMAVDSHGLDIAPEAHEDIEEA